MDPVHIHLLSNHVPVLGTFFGLLLLLYALLRTKHEVRRVALVVLVLMGLVAPVVYFSGDEAEHWAEDAGLDHDRIEAHEDAGKKAFILLLVQGVLAAGVLAVHILPTSARLRDRAAWALVPVGLLTFAAVVWTSNTGGHIKHGEEMGVEAPKPGAAGH